MPIIDLHLGVPRFPLEQIPHCYSYGSSHMVSTRCHLLLVLGRGEWEYDAGGGGVGRFGCHESKKSQSLWTDLMDFFWLAVWGWATWGLQKPFSGGARVCSNISEVMLFSGPLCNSAARYYYLVYLWLSFIPSLPQALWKANNYNTFKVLYKHRALKNESYLFALQLLSMQLFLLKCHLR